jgi:4-amino-4-deoxy-L-arabinose transferase-like glycosyltransferase
VLPHKRSAPDGFAFSQLVRYQPGGSYNPFRPALPKEVSNLSAIAAAIFAKRDYRSAVAAVILMLVGVRLVCAALIPLSFDESYYWIWSKHLAGGYYDHPPLNAFFIRLGTTLFGDTEFGVRAVSVLLALPASWAVWRSATILFEDDKLGATAALYFNLTLVMAAGSVIATHDNPTVVAAALLLLTLAKLFETGRGVWWIAIGAVFGVGMLANYTMIFFSVTILIWLLLTPQLRGWLLTPWPWISGLIALAVFSPTLIWNAEHDWASILYNYNRRLVPHEWPVPYTGDFLLSQIGFATPPIFVLGWLGLTRMLRGGAMARSARVLINAAVLPIVIYCVWHSLHERVEGNWPAPIYPAFVIAAAVAAEQIEWRGAWASIVYWSRRLAAPIGLGIAACIYSQAIFAILPLGAVDPTARALGAGWRDLGAKMDQVRLQIGAPVVLTLNYGLTGWLAFYLPSHPPVEQINQRIRYVNAPSPEPALFDGPIMYVCSDECREISSIRERFTTVELVADLARTRRGVAIQHYSVYRVSGPIGPPLDPISGASSK